MQKKTNDWALVRDSLYGTTPETTYAGITSFMRRKYTRDLAGADVAVTGVPFDTATTNRPGARLGPRSIRAASTMLAWERPYGMAFDPFDKLAVVDCGDCSFDFGRPESVPDEIESHAFHIIDQGPGLLALGGDHFIAYPLLKAHARKHGKPLALLHFDAHSDSWYDENDRIDHGTMFYWAAKYGFVDPSSSVQIGLRTTNHDTLGFNVLDAPWVHGTGIEKTVAKTRELLGDAPVYITFDIDCLDPSYAPGTGTPVCGGLTTHQAMSILRGLAGINVVGMDVVEVAPQYDVAEITSLAAAHIAMEMLYLYASGLTETAVALGCEHTASYYAATRDRIEFPELKGEHRADVAVVGGGFTGVSTALFLAERGYDVALVEAERIGWGASGRNGGQLIDGFVESSRIEQRAGPDAARMAWDMGLESRNIVVDRVRDYGIDCDLKFGYLDLAMKQREVRALAEEVLYKREQNYPHELTLITEDEVPDYVGSDRYIGGLHNDGNGHLHPLNLCIGEARAAASLGARIFECSRVTGIRHGQQPQLVTADGFIRAGKIVLAGNAYLGATEPRIRNAVIPAGSYIIGTAVLDEQLAAELLPRDSACCDQRAALDYFRLTPDKRLLFGGLCNYSGRDPRSIKAALEPKMLRVFPQLAGTRIEFEWGGYIAISVNRIPQFGRIENNTYYAQGYSGHGVAPTHLAGKMLADVVAGDSEQFDVFSRVRHISIPGGRWLANPLLALGMLYFRLRDLL